MARPAEDREGRLESQALDGLAGELLAIHEHAYGASAEKITIHQADDFLVAFIDGLRLQKSEQFMIESGNEEAVLRLRSLYQRHIGPTFRAAVERATGRRIVSVASTTALDDRPYCVEIFRMKPHSSQEAD